MYATSHLEWPIWLFIIYDKIQQLLDKGLDGSKKVVYKAGEYLGNKIVDAVTKSNDDNIEKQEPIEKIIIPPEKSEEIIIPPEKKRRNIKQTEKKYYKNGTL